MREALEGVEGSIETASIQHLRFVRGQSADGVTLADLEDFILTYPNDSRDRLSDWFLDLINLYSGANFTEPSIATEFRAHFYYDDGRAALVTPNQTTAVGNGLAAISEQQSGYNQITVSTPEAMAYRMPRLGDYLRTVSIQSVERGSIEQLSPSKLLCKYPRGQVVIDRATGIGEKFVDYRADGAPSRVTLQLGVGIDPSSGAPFLNAQVEIALDRTGEPSMIRLWCGEKVILNEPLREGCLAVSAKDGDVMVLPASRRDTQPDSYYASQGVEDVLIDLPPRREPGPATQLLTANDPDDSPWSTWLFAFNIAIVIAIVAAMVRYRHNQ